ncbi:hypothetical protein HDV63DRAFT_365898 [Trichoderma sp. SZMC 28014]
MHAVLTHIISQLRPGADLSRVVLPTFILEPRSMLERITKCADSCRHHTLNGSADWVLALCATPRCSCIFRQSRILLNDSYQSSSFT